MRKVFWEDVSFSILGKRAWRSSRKDDLAIRSLGTSKTLSRSKTTRVSESALLSILMIGSKESTYLRMTSSAIILQGSSKDRSNSTIKRGKKSLPINDHPWVSLMHFLS